MSSGAMRKGSDEDRHRRFGVESKFLLVLLYLFIVICILY